MHDLVHGIWHLDRGFPYTLKNTLVRPGITARAYIEGKRAGHFNLVTMLVILVGLNLVVSNWLFPQEQTTVVSQRSVTSEGMDTAAAGPSELVTDATPELQPESTAAPAQPLDRWLKENRKWVILSLVPLLSLASLIVFRRLRYNYTEHLVINSFLLAGILTFYLAGLVLQWLLQKWITGTVQAGNILTLLFVPVAYWQAFRHRYRLAGWLWRMAAVMILFALLFTLVFIAGVLLYALSQGKSGIVGRIGFH